jgi:hypothetical protein
MPLLPPFFKTLYALCGISLLVACSPGEPTVLVQSRIEPISIPAGLESCPAIPTPPDPDNPSTTQRDVAIYLVELVAVAEQCKLDLRTLNRVIADFNARAEEFNEIQASEIEEAR